MLQFLTRALLPCLVPVVTPLLAVAILSTLLRTRPRRGAAVAALSALVVAGWGLLAVRPAGRPSVDIFVAHLGAGMTWAYHADALALVFLICTSLGFALMFLRIALDSSAEVPQLQMVGWLLTLSGISHLFLSRSLLGGYPGWELALAGILLGLRTRSVPNLVWAAIPASLLYLGAVLGLAAAGGSSDYTVVPPEALSGLLAALLVGAAILRLTVVPGLLQPGAHRLTGSMALAGSAIYLLARLYGVGDGRLPRWTVGPWSPHLGAIGLDLGPQQIWLGSVMAAVGTLVAISAGWRAATRRDPASESPLIFAGLAAAALGLGTPLGVAAGILLGAVGILAAPALWMALGSNWIPGRVVGAWSLAALPGSAGFLAAQLGVQAGAEAGTGYAVLSLLSMGGLLLVAYAALVALQDTSGQSRRSGLVGASTLVFLALLAAVPGASAASLIVPAAASVVRIPVTAVSLTRTEEYSPGGAWSPASWLVVVALVAGGVTLTGRRSALSGVPAQLPHFRSPAWVTGSAGRIRGGAGRIRDSVSGRPRAAILSLGGRFYLGLAVAAAVLILVER